MLAYQPVELGLVLRGGAARLSQRGKCNSAGLATAFGERLRYVTIQGGWAMDHVVERVMTSCENYERQGREDIRAKVGQYLEKLASTGHRDVEELTYYGLAYLRILQEGPDPRYSNC